jgi:hypothetical protein
MKAKRYTIQNKTREAPVGCGVTAINCAREPLTALRVMVEGLGSGEEPGLWLTQVRVIPMVPRISPFDLLYLDADHRVVERVELLPTSEIPRFKKPAASVLVLPLRTFSSAQVDIGDQFVFDEVAEPDEAAEISPSKPELQVSAEPAAVATQAVEPPAGEAPRPLAEFESPFLNPFLNVEPEPLEQAPAIEFAKPDRQEPAREQKEEFVLAEFLRTEPIAVPAVVAEEQPSAPQDLPQLTLPATKKRARKKPAPVESTAPIQIVKPEAESTATLAKKPAVNRLFRWLYPALYDQNRRSAERRPSQGVVAYDFVDDTPRMHEVGNVSSHGLYLRTQERWEPGTLVSLTMQCGGPYESDSQHRVEFECAVVREGADGVGMSFVLPAGMELKLWEMPGRNGADETDPQCIVRELRMARALAFMRRICPPADERVTELLHKTLSNVRAANTVEIALKAERLLAQEPDAYCMAAHPDLMLRTLEHGSWVDVEWLQELWGGLLATSCTFEGQDESNLAYINLLSRLAPLPTQILTMACAKTMQAMTGHSTTPSAPLACSAEEIARITRSNNLLKIYKSIGELSELGLVERNPRSVSPSNPGEAKARPTQLGLEMFARCNGQRGATIAA